MRLIAVGRARPADPEAALVARYVERIRPRLTVTELPDARGAPAEVRRRDSQALLGSLERDAWAVALDLGGAMPDSDEFAALLERWLTQPRPVCFLIGGAEGLDRAVLDRADFTLSLGRCTWPHLLARAMLAEQIYRARAIVTRHPYHRAHRP